MSQFGPRSAFARALNKVLSENRFTAIELAEAGGTSDRMVGYAQTGERDMQVSVAERISRYLCQHGETRPALALLCPRFAVVERPSGTSNGCVKDELVALVRSMADADSAHGQRDAETLRAAIAAMRTALADLEAEANAL